MDRKELLGDTLKMLHEFVRRVSSEDGNKSEAEIAILPQMAKMIIECTY